MIRIKAVLLKRTNFINKFIQRIKTIRTIRVYVLLRPINIINIYLVF